MGDKDVRDFQRNELATYLERLAQQLRNGALDKDGTSWKIPQRIGVKTSFKEKKGVLVTKLSLSWSTLGDYSEADRKEITSWKESFKPIKRDLNASFKKLHKMAEAGEFPDNATLEKFVADSAAFAARADPDWSDAMREYNDHLENLKRAAADRKLDMVIHELRDLKVKMGECHRHFR